MTMKPSTTFYLIMLIAIFLVTACASVVDSAENPLPDTDWTLITIDRIEADDGMTLQFSADAISGSDGCNSFNSGYTIENGKIVVDGSAFATTMMACPDKDAALANRYVQALTTVTQFSIVDNILTLTTDEGDLRFEAAVPATLQGNRWQLTSIRNELGVVMMEIDKNIFMIFDDALVSGSSGCNNFSGAITIDNEQLSFGNLASTMMLCPEDDVNARETEFLAALSNVTSYTIERDTLTLLNESGEMVASFIVNEDPQ